jgi:hypothetical protein
MAERMTGVVVRRGLRRLVIGGVIGLAAFSPSLGRAQQPRTYTLEDVLTSLRRGADTLDLARVSPVQSQALDSVSIMFRTAGAAALTIDQLAAIVTKSHATFGDVARWNPQPHAAWAEPWFYDALVRLRRIANAAGSGALSNRYVGVAIFGCFTMMQAQRGYMPFNDDDSPAPLPLDAAEKTEWAFARLIYPSGRFYGLRGYWTIDSPKADRQFSQGVRRLTRIHTRSKEEFVSLDKDEVFKWPWLYAVETGHWQLTDDNCKKLREYLLRGGFLMTDDFHGTVEWENFMKSLHKVFSSRPVLDLRVRNWGGSVLIGVAVFAIFAIDDGSIDRFRIGKPVAGGLRSCTGFCRLAVGLAK